MVSPCRVLGCLMGTEYVRGQIPCGRNNLVCEALSWWVYSVSERTPGGRMPPLAVLRER